MTTPNRINSLLLLAVFLCTVVPTTVYSQKAKTHVLTMDEAKLVKKDAATLFAASDFNGALAGYKDLVKADPKNIDYNYKLGYCYLQTNANKRAALPHLEFACKSKDAKKDWQFYLGLANMYNERWDEAIVAFREFKDAKLKPVKDYPSADRMIENCNNAKELIQHPVNCNFSNIGKSVNTMYEEYNPWISADGKQLVFTSRRKGNVGGFIEDLGIYTADIYWTLWKDTIWSKAKSLGGNVNTEWDEETVGLSPDGNMVMIYFDNSEFYADLGASSLKGKMWQKPVMMPTQVNSKNFEGGATMSLDGQTIIFSSVRKEGLGESDLWMVHKEKNGEWTAPVNLGNDINTKEAEEAPCFSLDGKTLYFASKGWNSMGGFDLFRSRWDASTSKWSKPENLGYPLNDAEDNTFIAFTGDMQSAYISAIRPEGLGDLDIYKVDFPDTTHHAFTYFISGSVSSATGGKIEMTKVSIENKSTGAKSEYVPAQSNNMFVLPASPGDFILHVEGYNFEPYNEDIQIEASFPPKQIVHNVQVKSSK